MLAVRVAAAEWTLPPLAKYSWRAAWRDRYRHRPGENITLYANIVGPFRNPTETYEYYSLPYCKQPPGGATARHRQLSLGEALAGRRPVATPLVIPFRTDVGRTVLCEVELGPGELGRLRQGVWDDYYFQVLYDDLPLWGFIGTIVGGAGSSAGGPPSEVKHTEVLYTHLHLELSFNGNYVVETVVHSDPLYTINISEASAGTKGTLSLNFSYSAHWRESPLTFDQRMAVFTRFALNVYHLRTHRMTALTMCAVLAVLLLSSALLFHHMSLRIHSLGAHGLHSSSAQQQQQQQSAQGGGSSSGGRDGTSISHPGVGATREWARWMTAMCTTSLACLGSSASPPAPPPLPNLLSAAVGVGCQLLAVAAGLAALAVLGLVPPYSPGRLQLACLQLYALTSGIAGYVSGLQYASLGGTQWPSNVALCAVLYGGPLLAIFAATNLVAAAHRSTAAVPLGAVAALLALWALVAVPLTALGGWLAARRSHRRLGPNSVSWAVLSSRTTQQAGAAAGGVRPPWYARPFTNTALQMLLAGCVPFSAVCFELHYLYAGLWGFKVLAVPGLHSLIWVLLVAISATSALIVVLFHMALPGGRSKRRGWRAFLCGGSTSFFVYGYSFYYYVKHSDMSGLLQASFYFGYNAVLCYALLLGLGCAGFCATALFMRALALKGRR